VLSVVIYARNDGSTIHDCLRSVARECDGAEVIVVDDASADATPECVARDFPVFRLIRHDDYRGWPASVRECLDAASGEAVAFLGAHCQAREGWLRAAETLVAAGHEIVTGRGSHGNERFLARFEALSIHAGNLGTESGEAAFLWDDNFVARPDLLHRALPQAGQPLSDGAGAFLLSRRLAEQGVRVHYGPSMQIDHVTHSLGGQWAMWGTEMAENAVAMRRVDPTIPGAGLMRRRAVACVVFAGGRLVQTIRPMMRARHAAGASLLEMPLHVATLSFMMTAYFGGLWRELGRASEGEGDGARA